MLFIIFSSFFFFSSSFVLATLGVRRIVIYRILYQYNIHDTARFRWEKRPTGLAVWNSP